MQQMYKVKTVAKLLDVHQQTVRDWISSGKLEVTRFEGSVRISQEQLDNFLNQKSA